MENLNRDLHDLIYSGEGEDSGAEDGMIDSMTYRSANTRKVPYKKMGSGKPQNLDLLPSNYIAEATATENMMHENTMAAN